MMKITKCIFHSTVNITCDQGPVFHNPSSSHGPASHGAVVSGLEPLHCP